MDLSNMTSGVLILAIDGHDETVCDCEHCAEWNRRIAASREQED